MEQRDLTKAEEQIMHIIWEIEKGFLKDIIDRMPEPQPAYTTVSTVVRVLVKKGFVGFKTYGKINEYFPIIQKADYFNSRVKPMISEYFHGSPATVASYFANAKLNLSELEEIRNLIDEKIAKLKSRSSKTTKR